MSDGWAVRDTKRDIERPAEDREDAERRKDDMVSLGASPEQIEIVPPGKEAKPDGGTETVEPEVVDHSEAGEEPETVEASPIEAGTDLPERSVSDDPLTWVPGDFVDTIDGTKAINRKGFAVLSHFYKIETESTVEVPPEETDFEFCRVKAVATT